MTNFKSKHVALLKNKKGCADVYCVALIELQAKGDDFIQEIIETASEDDMHSCLWDGKELTEAL